MFLLRGRSRVDHRKDIANELVDLIEDDLNMPFEDFRKLNLSEIL